MRTIGVVTVARSDYGIYFPLLRQIEAAQDLQLYLMVTGMHLSPEFGRTERAIEADGFRIAERIEVLVSSDSPEGIAKSMGLGVLGFAQSFGRFKPDILVVLGDRFEMYAAALAALPFKIPVAHIHGGEVTQGAIDDALRHSITKLSHLHFVATTEYAKRVAQLGEEPWRITVSGAPSLDNLRTTRLLTIRELEAKFKIHLEQPLLLVTFHPVTLEYESTDWQVGELLSALESSAMPVLFTMPNADTSGRTVMEKIEHYVRTHPNAEMVDNLGIQGYFSVMAIAAAMVGNSSSGVLEAASFQLPVVNIGSRQHGRVRSANVIDVGYRKSEILSGIHKATSRCFREELRDLVNPYGCGHASEIIVRRLREIALNSELLSKRFCDYPVTPLASTESNGEAL